ncbi:MAG: hypothetical protein HKM06_05255 [Spirochaetales bacterium]|nr:hypothetical protein [Spirochaetales bacterium]
MTFSDVLDAVSAEILNKGKNFESQKIRHIVACDLMSDVLVTEYEEILLVTSLPSEQTARTADMVGAAGILLVNGKAAQSGLAELCRKQNLTLLRTPCSTFETCWRLGGRQGALS